MSTRVGVPVVFLAFFLMFAIFGADDLSTFIGIGGSAVSLVACVIMAALEIQRPEDADY